MVIQNQKNRVQSRIKADFIPIKWQLGPVAEIIGGCDIFTPVSALYELICSSELHFWEHLITTGVLVSQLKWVTLQSHSLGGNRTYTGGVASCHRRSQYDGMP